MKIAAHKKPHSVYLVGNKKLNYYKIGVSNNPHYRIDAFSLPFPIELLKILTLPDRWVALRVEKALHRLYRTQKLRGEWFRSIDAENFVFDAEYIAAGQYELAEQAYKSRGGYVSEDVKDRRVLAALKEDGIEAAREVRRDLSN